MIIWSGWGILVIVTAGLGMIAGLVVNVLAALLLGPMAGIILGTLAGGASAATINWWLSSYFGRKSRTLVDPQTGEQVVIKKNHSLFFVSMESYTGIFALLGVIFAIAGGLGHIKNKKLEAQYPGKVDFDKANKLINRYKNESSFGNTPEAKLMASQFSSTLKEIQSKSFKGGSKKNWMTKGDFLTYCLINKEGIHFFTHVPSLRSYKDYEAKERLKEISWLSGALAAKVRIPNLNEKARLTVALRGIGYDFEYIMESTADDKKIPSSSTNQEKLMKLFDPKLQGSPPLHVAAAPSKTPEPMENEEAKTDDSEPTPSVEESKEEEP
jgi:hypothetical protein